MKPLFIWAGGKSKMWKHYEPIVKQMDFKHYCEPFFGGGAMLLKVLETRSLDKIVIGDLNKSIVNVYTAIKYNVNSFINEVDKLEAQYIPLSKEDRKRFYYQCRHEHAFDYQNWTKTKEAAYQYFLLKTSFNGIWQVNKNTNSRFGTSAGLLNQKTNIYDKDNVMLWNELLQNVKIVCGDWKITSNQIDKKDTFYFNDPPYRDCFADYATSFSDNHLLELINFCDTVDYVFLCNKDAGDNFFETYKGGLNLFRFDITYTAGRRKKTSNGFEAKKAIEILLWIIWIELIRKVIKWMNLTKTNEPGLQ
jgi:DNA adenine methylase